MKATATRANGFRHTVKIRSHELTADEPRRGRRDGHGPEPAGAAGRQPRLVYGRDDGDVRRSARAGTSAASRSPATTRPPSAAARPASSSSCASPSASPTSRSSACASIAAKCPVHRTLDGEVMFDERVERVTLAQLRSRTGCAPSCSTPRRRPRSTCTAASTRRCSCRCTSRRRPARRLHPPARRPAPPRGRDLFPRRPPGRRRGGPARTALREAEEEIGLAAGAVELIGALQPTPTIATNYAVYPFVGLIEPGRAMAAVGGARSPRCSSSRSIDLRAGLRAAPAAAPRRPVPDRRLLRRRAPHLGRDGTDRSRTSSSGSPRNLQ